MAQFGIHALIALYFISVLPVFSPAVTRSSFCTGLFIGSVFPDLDVYAEAGVHFFDSKLGSEMHRTLLHSGITAVVLYFILWCVELIFKKKYKKYVYDYAAAVAVSPNFAAQNRQRYDILGTYKTRTANYKAFGGGLFIGIIAHCVIDIIFWFSPIDFLFPLPHFGIGEPINIWINTSPPDYVGIMLTLSELLCYGCFLTAFRLRIVGKLGKWCDIQPVDSAAVDLNTNRSDSDIEHGTMDYSVVSFKDIICPLDTVTLNTTKTYLKITKILEIFQYVYFAIATILAVVLHINDYVMLVVYVEVLLVCMPSFYWLAWQFRKILLLKMD